MGVSGLGSRATQATTSVRRATRSFIVTSRSAARGSVAVFDRASRALHRITGASGASRTGLAQLIELTAAGSLADGFVAAALAGTLFFSASVTQARSQIALALLITMTPFVLIAPFIGPMLDRVQQGRRYILVGTMLARGLLCWGMAGAVQHGDTLTLLPAAFGVLLLQKAYGVTRAAVTPRLLPREITLVTANARCALATLIGSSVGVSIAAGIAWLISQGHDSTGAAWVLRIGTVLYLAGMVPGLRLPTGVDEPVTERAPGQQPGPSDQARRTKQATAQSQPSNWPDRDRRQAPAAGGSSRPWWSLFKQPVGPVVSEAIRGNLTLRAYSGFMIFFLAFILRTVHFGHSDKLALGEMAVAVAAGGFFGTAIGAALKSKAPQMMIFAMLTATTVITSLCAVFFGLWAAVIVAFCAAVGQTLVKLALDSIVQREIDHDIRSSTFAASETLHQLSWVLGGLLGLLLSLTDSGVTGLAVASICLAISLGSMVATRRSRILRARRTARSNVDVVSHSA
jgi:MFS family permease